MREIRKIKISSFLLSYFLLDGGGLFARLVPKGREPLGWCEFFQLIQNVINFLLKISFLTAILGFIVAGFLFFFSGGSEERVGTAKKVFGKVFVGMLIAIASWLIIDFFIKMLAGENLAHILGHPWHKLECR